MEIDSVWGTSWASSALLRRLSNGEIAFQLTVVVAWISDPVLRNLLHVYEVSIQKPCEKRFSAFTWNELKLEMPAFSPRL